MLNENLTPLLWGTTNRPRTCPPRTDQPLLAHQISIRIMGCGGREGAAGRDYWVLGLQVGQPSLKHEHDPELVHAMLLPCLTRSWSRLTSAEVEIALAGQASGQVRLRESSTIICASNRSLPGSCAAGSRRHGGSVPPGSGAMPGPLRYPVAHGARSAEGWRRPSMAAGSCSLPRPSTAQASWQERLRGIHRDSSGRDIAGPEALSEPATKARAAVGGF